MKKKQSAQSGLFTLRILWWVAVCLMIAETVLASFQSGAPANNSQRTLTFAERVAYQRAIEKVYWSHRIWPTERTDPKPSLDAVMSQAQLEKKVTEYVRKSQALEDYWQRPITSEQLQAEMNRMAVHTKQPDVLRELFAALGNDPFVAAECLARPILAERLFKSAIENQDANQAVAQPIKFVNRNRAAFRGYTLPVVATPRKVEGTCIDAWAATSTVNAPTAREWHTAVWTGSEMIVWGGLDGSGYSNTGARYNPSTDSLTATSTINADPRARHTAVWTGSEMMVWGGIAGNGGVLNTGGRYNPATDSWTITSTANAPDGRESHTAVWTGSEMVVWGGWATNPLGTGGRYNPVSDSWTAVNTTNAPSARYNHTAIWTGSEMIVWGGEDFSGNFNTGGRYNPGTDSWTATSTTNAPDPRIVHTAVWTGSEMIVWGGDSVVEVNTGGRYNPPGDTWLPTSLTNAPTRRAGHTAVWSGSEMIVWGGYDGFNDVNTGARYGPSTNSWVATSTINAPTGRDTHTAVWTGNEMLVWGGIDDSGHVVNTGGRYCGQYPSPTPTPTPSGVYEAWVARYDGGGLNDARAIAVDVSENVYVSGTSVGSGTWDYVTIKYNATGQQEWLARYDGPDNGNDFANAMTIDGSGNVYVTGSSANHCGSADFATIKYNSAGQEVWVARHDGGTGVAIAVDSLGNVDVTGGDAQGWATINYNPSGAEQWVAHHTSGTPAAIAVDKAGNVYVTGGSDNDYATIKYDASGQQQWVAQYNGPGNGTDDATGIALDGSGNVYVTGYSLGVGEFNAYDYATIKYDASGQQQWVSRYNGPSNGADHAQAIAVDELGNAYVTGDSSGPGTDNYATVKYNSDGQQQWVARYSGPSNIDFAVAIALDGVGNVYVTGSSLDSGGIYTDYATIKYDSAGQEQWVVRYDGPGSGGDFAHALAVDGSGNVYVTGTSDDINLNEDYATVKYGQGPTPTPTPSATASPTATSTATPTSTPTASPTPTVTCVPTATATPQPTPTATFTATPAMTPTSTPTPTATATPTSTPTVSPSSTPTQTPCTGRCSPTPRPRPTPAPRP